MSDTTRLSLREELGGSSIPEFALELPDGWERWDMTEENRQAWLRRARERFSAMQRPDLNALANRLVNESFDAAKKANALAMFVPTQDSETTLWIPASLIVAPVQASGGGTLDSHVLALIRERGGAPLLGDKRFVCTYSERKVQIDGGELIHGTAEYLTPIPGTDRKRGLNFVASLPRSTETPSDHESVAGLRLLFDAVVSTLRWRKPQRKEGAA